MEPVEPALPRQGPKVKPGRQTSADSTLRQLSKLQLWLETSGSSIYQISCQWVGTSAPDLAPRCIAVKRQAAPVTPRR
jgi:hypothetical protein